MTESWLLGIIVSLIVAIIAWFHGKKTGDNAAVARNAVARQEVQQKLDKVDLQTEARKQKIEGIHAIDSALADIELKDRLRKPVEDSDVDRVVRESDEDFAIEHSDR